MNGTLAQSGRVSSAPSRGLQCTCSSGPMGALRLHQHRLQKHRRAATSVLSGSELQRCHAQANTTTLQASTSNGASAFPPLLPLDGEYESAHAFSHFANWLVPGRILVGRYPYVEPSRCRSREQGTQHMRQILGAAMTTFVSLQAETPPQQQMRLAGANGFLPYKATAELLAVTLTGPPPMEIVEGLRNPTLDQFLPARRRANSPSYQQYAERETVQFVHWPIADLSVPDGNTMLDIVHDLELRVAAGGKLYMHCWGGRGRVGTVGACLLASMYNLTAEEALTRVQRAFDTRKDDQRRSPETDEQHAFVRDFVKQLASTAA